MQFLSAPTIPVTQIATETIYLLVISRETAVHRLFWEISHCNSWHLETATNGWQALERIEAGCLPHLIVLDLPRSDGESLHVLRWLRRSRPELPIILISHPDDVSREGEETALGAQEFLVGPFKENCLEAVIRRHLESANGRTKTELANEDMEPLGDDTFLLGASPIMQRVRAQAELLAQTNVPVLIVGEPGSGKDTIARLIHKSSSRSGFKFVKIDCARTSAHTLDEELLGPDSSSTNEQPRSRGIFEIADSGTIYFDNVAALPMNLQEKLVHIMQEKQLLKPGLQEYIEIGARIVAAAGENIEQALKAKQLREDLYYRLSAFTVYVPALRQRKDEIPFLLRYFLRKWIRQYGRLEHEFPPAVVEACQRYSWPGNIRELESFVKRYVKTGDDEISVAGSIDSLAAIEFPEPKTIDFRTHAITESNTRFDGRPLKSLIRELTSEAERNAIAAALKKTGWNRKAAARLLSIGYRTMLYKIDQYHMDSHGSLNSTTS